MRQLVIVGTGGFGREVHEMIEDINHVKKTYEIAGFLDENSNLFGKLVHGLPVLGDLSWLDGRAGLCVVLGVGSPASKRRIVEKVKPYSVSFPPIVHPRSGVGRRVMVGNGAIVGNGVILTTDLAVQPFATLNINVTVGHDTIIGEFATISPGVHVSGSVTIGAGADIGTGATIIQGVSIGDWSVIGAGASVIRDVAANTTAVGVPAKDIKKREPGWQRLHE